MTCGKEEDPGTLRAPPPNPMDEVSECHAMIHQRTSAGIKHGKFCAATIQRDIAIMCAALLNGMAIATLTSCRSNTEPVELT